MAYYYYYPRWLYRDLGCTGLIKIDLFVMMVCYGFLSSFMLYDFFRDPFRNIYFLSSFSLLYYFIVKVGVGILNDK